MSMRITSTNTRPVPTTTEIIAWLEIEYPHVMDMLDRDLVKRISDGLYVGHYATYQIKQTTHWIEWAIGWICAGKRPKEWAYAFQKLS